METILTERLILKEPSLIYLDDFYQYAKKPHIGPMAGWSPHASIIESEFILRDMIAKQEVYAIHLNGSGTMIGTIGLHPHETDEEARLLGYVLDDTYWGQGIMIEAAQALIKHAFTKLGIKMIYCFHFAHNYQSKRVIEKLGFEYFKTTSDPRFAIYSNEQYGYYITKEMMEDKKHE